MALLLTLIRAMQFLFTVVGKVASLDSVRAPRIVGCLWIVLGVYWAVSALRQESTKMKEHFIERLRHLVPAMVAFLLLSPFVGELRTLLAFAMFLASFYRKARKEEAWLAREFGETFAGHAKQTGMLLPRFF